MDNRIKLPVVKPETFEVASANAWGSYEVSGAQAKIDLGSVKTIKSIFCGGGCNNTSQGWYLKYGTSGYEETTVASGNVSKGLSNAYNDLNVQARYIVLKVGGNGTNCEIASLFVLYK